MSAVIKSDAGKGVHGVRGLTLDRPAPPLSADQQRVAALEIRLNEARNEVTALHGVIRRLEEAAVTARDEGRAKGLIEGRAQAEDRANELAESVAVAVGEAVALLAIQTRTFERSTGDLTALALSRIVGDVSDRQSLIIDTVRRATALLFADVTVAVEVSTDDFPDAAALQAAIPAGCVVHIHEHLPSGSCRLKLKMGEADLDLSGQVARLSTVLMSGSTPA